jgi:hypothetical protein
MATLWIARLAVRELVRWKIRRWLTYRRIEGFHDYRRVRPLRRPECLAVAARNLLLQNVAGERLGQNPWHRPNAPGLSKVLGITAACCSSRDGPLKIRSAQSRSPDNRAHRQGRPRRLKLQEKNNSRDRRPKLISIGLINDRRCTAIERRTASENSSFIRSPNK